MDPILATTAASQWSIKRLCEILERGKISEREFFQNIMWAIVATEDAGWEICLSFISTEQLVKFAQFMRAELVPIDYMPTPDVLFPSNSAEAIENSKQFFRPRYMKLLSLVEQQP